MGKTKKKSKQTAKADNKILGASKAEESAIRALMVKNISYSLGIGRRVEDIERVYVIELVSTQTTQTLTTGGIATSTSMDPTTRIDSFSRWAAVFKQYTVLECTATTQVLGTNGGAAANGQIWVRVEEESGAPTSGIVRSEKAVLNLHAPSDDKQSSCTIKWRPSSSEDLAFIYTGTGFAFAYHKVYANSSITGTSATDSSSQLVTLFYYRVAFRYLTG